MSRRLRGVLHASPLGGGPWLFLAIALAIAAVYAPAAWTEGSRALFRAIVLHVHALALVATAGASLVAGRRVALALGEGEREAAGAAHATLAAVTGIGAALAAMAASAAIGLDARTGIAATGLAAASACLFSAAALADARGDGEALVAAAVMGVALSVGGTIGLGRILGLAGAIHGLAAGEVAAAAILGARALDASELRRALDPVVVRWSREDAGLGIGGALLAVGLLADKAIFAYALGARAGALGTLRSYEAATSVGGAVAVPALAVFATWVEGPLRAAYRDLVRTIAAGGRREDVAARKRALALGTREALARAAEVVGAPGLLALAAAPAIATALRLEPGGATTLRVAVVAAGLEIALLVYLSALAQLDARSRVLAVAAAFATTHLACATALAALGSDGHALGFAAACAVALVVAHVALDGAVAEVDRRILERQAVEP